MIKVKDTRNNTVFYRHPDDLKRYIGTGEDPATLESERNEPTFQEDPVIFNDSESYDIESYFAQNTTNNDDNIEPVPPLRRSNRETRQNARYYNEDFVNNSDTDSSSSDVNLIREYSLWCCKLYLTPR